VSGVLGGKFGRRTTGKPTWEEAKVVIAGWESAGNWEGSEPTRTVPTDLEQPGATIARAVQSFLAEHEAQSAPSTLRKYKFLIAKVTDYSTHKGYDSVDVRKFPPPRR
jgi:hypothetical protein